MRGIQRDSPEGSVKILEKENYVFHIGAKDRLYFIPRSGHNNIEIKSILVSEVY